MTPSLEFVCELTIRASAPHLVADGPGGMRRVIQIAGGEVAGPLLNGTIPAFGADWQAVAPDGLATLDARHLIETHDGAMIEVTSQGLRHAAPEVGARIAAGEDVPFSEYYMRTAIRLQTAHPAYDWVNRTLFVASGGKVGSTVRLALYRVS